MIDKKVFHFLSLRALPDAKRKVLSAAVEYHSTYAFVEVSWPYFFL